jgi:hypothetical protein
MQQFIFKHVQAHRCDIKQRSAWRFKDVRNGMISEKKRQRLFPQRPFSYPAIFLKDIDST